MPKIEIDGIEVEAEAGATIIEVADRISVPIPRFCYHAKLSVAANCRMCLVSVEKSAKALPACATPITEGMKVWTKSKETIAAQRAVMEFLLINHPLDCPICDQGGECELQDISLEYGRGDSEYDEPKRVVLDHNKGPLIATEMTRCIQCTRCVRFGDEISGERELGATGRGEHMEIGTYVQATLNSEVSGNIIDLCPVGALTSKPFRFTARAWELHASPSIAPHDCIGSHIYIHSKDQKVMRVVPREAELLNEVWLSDRDRFSYQALAHADRLRKPLLNRQRWGTSSWEEAIKYALAGIKLCIETYGADQLGVLVSPNTSNEELYLLQKFVRALGCNNIDHRLRQLDFSQQDHAPIFPNLGIQFKQLAQQDVVLLVGIDVAKEQPLASIQLRKMVKGGGKVCSIAAVDYHYNFAVVQKAIVPARDILSTLAAVAKELLRMTNSKVANGLSAPLGSVVADHDATNIAAILLSGQNRHIIYGNLVQSHPNATQIIALINLIARVIDGTYGCFSDGANAAGAWLTGCVPHRMAGGKATPKQGLNALQMLQTPLKGYILYGIEPEYESILGNTAIDTLKQADFILSINSFQSDTLLEIADVILPRSEFAEYDGSTVNINGSVQHFNAAVEPYGESRPGWKILRVLGTFAEIPGFNYNKLHEISAELENILSVRDLPKWEPLQLEAIHVAHTKEITRIAPISLYAIDGLVRRAVALQHTQDAQLQPQIMFNSATAQNLNVIHAERVLVSTAQNANKPVLLDVVIDDRVADYTAVIYQANDHTMSLGLPYASVEVRKC